MTSTHESWLAVHLDQAEDTALHADLSSRLANLLALVDWLTEQAAQNTLPGATRHELAEQIDQWLAQLAALLETTKAAQP